MIKKYEFAGFISRIENQSSNDPRVVKGSHFHGFFSYDTSAIPNENQIYNGANFDLTAVIYRNDVSFIDRTQNIIDAYAKVTSGNAPEFDESTVPISYFSSTAHDPPTLIIRSMSGSSYLGIWFSDYTGVLIPDPILPEELPELSKWNKKIFWHAIGEEGQNGFYLGELDILTQFSQLAAPENLHITK